jgi:hypothetical protein
MAEIYNPSQAEIRRQTERIQSHWTEDQRMRRQYNGPSEDVETPVVRLHMGRHFVPPASEF